MIKITIANKTAWQTKMLRPFIVRIANEEFDGSTPARTRTRLTVRIVYHRGGADQRAGDYCSGYAYYNSSLSTVRVPNPAHGHTFPVADFCHVVGHEFGHNRGLRHSQMGWHHGNSCRRGSYTTTHYAWSAALPVPVPVVAKPRATTDEKRAKRLQAAQSAVLRWTKKQKLATTKLKLWQRKVKTLERTLAAAACAAPAAGGGQ